jgi:hypothetical protein
MPRLVHTADLHLGLKFTRGGYPPALRDELVARRIECLRGMLALATARKCEVFVVAGDLFDTPRVPKRLVRETAEILAGFEGVVAILPGNHDYAQEDDPLWPEFADALGERHHLLRRETPCDLRDQGVPLVLFPGVCHARHSKSHAVAWVAPALASLGLPPGVRRVGVAHGSLEGLSPDFGGDYFPMTRRDLEATGMDLWLLGHTHVRFPDRERIEGDRILFPATPEPDGFDCRHDGHAWILELAEDGTVSGESVRTGRHRFHTLTKTLTGETSLEELRADFASFDPARDLVKLSLSGRIPGALFDSRGEWLAELEKSVLYLETDLPDLMREITPADIGREFTTGSFPHRLLSGLAGTGGDADALQLAWDLVKEARS